jgi:hypothetical protein
MAALEASLAAVKDDDGAKPKSDGQKAAKKSSSRAKTAAKA